MLRNLGKASYDEEDLGGGGRPASTFHLFFDLISDDSLGRGVCPQFWSHNEDRSQLGVGTSSPGSLARADSCRSCGVLSLSCDTMSIVLSSQGLALVVVGQSEGKGA